MKITFNFNDELEKQVEEYAKQHFINKTAAIHILLKKGLEQEGKDNEQRQN